MNDWVFGPSFEVPPQKKESVQTVVEVKQRAKPGPKPHSIGTDKFTVDMKIDPELKAMIMKAAKLKKYGSKSAVVRAALSEFFDKQNEPPIEPKIVVESTGLGVTVEPKIVAGTIGAIHADDIKMPNEFLGLSNENPFSVTVGIYHIPDAKQVPGWFKRKMLKWCFGVEVNV
jgi:hypothetical protein